LLKHISGRSSRLLRIENLHAGYGDLEVLHGIDLDVNEGEIVALIGANGAGKTTTLRAISGLVAASEGSITFEGSNIGSWRSSQIVAEGVVQVPEGRKLFADMSVLENLRLGAYKRGRSDISGSLDEVFDLFPKLSERSSQSAGTLSGGEQQMLAIGRSLMTKPRFLMLDEPSLGLAPKLVIDIFGVIKSINGLGVTVMLVEQNAVHALQLSDRGYVLENGRVVLHGTGEELLGDDRVRTAYLGL
jgi:branched-chain amino acid transport system ATP-binding protein